MKKNIIKSILFLLLTACLLLHLRSALLPIWADWNNYGAARGFYEEPDNTVEVLILGSSISANGFSAMELYDQYGICAYNYGTARQPLLVSYYWLLEAYKHHSESLRVLVLEPSMLLDNDLVNDSHYNRGLAYMDFSANKYRAYRAFAGSTLGAIRKMSVFYNYHSRWNELTVTNMAEGRLVADTYLRGGNTTFQWLADTTPYDEIPILTGEYDPEAEGREVDKSSLNYYYKIADFCREHGIRLVLGKAVNIRGAEKWSSADHDTAAKLAEETGADLIDFCFSPYFEETGIVPYLDSIDRQHMNPWGSSKETPLLGRYLTEHYDLTDVREDPRYAFMKDQWAEYQSYVTTVKELCMTADPCDFLTTALSENAYTTILSVNSGGVQALTEDQRSVLSSLGLKELAVLKKGDSYCAVIEDGVVREKTSGGNAQSFSRRLRNGLQLRISGSATETSVSIGGTSCLLEGTGLHVVIYSGKYRKVILQDSFPTDKSQARESRDYEAVLADAEKAGLTFDEYPASLQNYCLYLRHRTMTLLGRDLASASLSEVIGAFRSQPDTRILIAVSKGDVSALDDARRTALREIGLANLADCQEGDAYTGIIEDGRVVSDTRSVPGEAVTAESLEYRLASGPGSENADITQHIGGKQLSMDEPGIYVYVYDGLQKKTVFDSAFTA